MAVDFSKFDSLVNPDQLKKDISEAVSSATDYEEVPKGIYIVGIENMEVKPTKAGDKLMFTVSCKIKETVDAPNKQDGRWIFFNRVIFGNRITNKWNDGKAIQGVITWVKKILTEEEDLTFKSYKQFADEILEIYQDVSSSIEMKIRYNPDDFNPITIDEVFDI